jgi:hypothetical protein
MSLLYRYSSFAIDSDLVILELSSFHIIKETKCGVWIYVYDKKRFVNLKAKKQFACRTKEEAIMSFKARKKRQVEILSNKLAIAKASLLLDENMRNIHYNDYNNEFRLI